ncbi:transposase [Actinopolyspora halophila]|uniref:transposase n=1 Tax=Actinopolyspora halophila TaxID=1850 RepID=UPI0012FC4703
MLVHGEDDHVHLLVEHQPQAAPSKLVNSLRSVAPRRLEQHFRMCRPPRAPVVTVPLRRLLRRNTAGHHPAVHEQPATPA